MRENKFHLIDMETWPRREHFQFYRTRLQMHYQLTIELDVTNVVKTCREKGIRFYPSMLYIIQTAINHNENFRMALDQEGRLGYYDYGDVSYTIFHDDDKTFSDIWSLYDPDFRTFYEGAVKDMEEYKDVKGKNPKPGRMACFSCISAVPWLHFTGFSNDTPVCGDMFYPVITYGKYVENNGRLILPFSMYINHAVADGYHSSKLLNEIQEGCDSFTGE